MNVEYRGAALATCEESWLRLILSELGIEINHSVPIYCDTIGSILLAKNPFYHARTNHIEVHCHFLQEKVLNGEIELQYVRTNDQQVVDIFTKALSFAKFFGFRDALEVWSMQAHSKLEGEC